MNPMYADKIYVIILIDKFHNFLHGAVVVNPYQASESAYSMIYMHNIVANLNLVKLFQR